MSRPTTLPRCSLHFLPSCARRRSLLHCLGCPHCCLRSCRGPRSGHLEETPSRGGLTEPETARADTARAESGPRRVLSRGGASLRHQGLIPGPLVAPRRFSPPELSRILRGWYRTTTRNRATFWLSSCPKMTFKEGERCCFLGGTIVSVFRLKKQLVLSVGTGTRMKDIGWLSWRRFLGLVMRAEDQ
jgi:hypothetical protein